MSLQANSTSSTMVNLTWSEPLYSQRNEMITGYSVEMCQTDPSGSCTTTLNHGAQTSLVISSLHPYYEYKWRVAAHTSVGRGSYSNYTSFQMPEDGE